MHISFRRILVGVALGSMLLTACTIAKANGVAQWTGQSRTVNQPNSVVLLACQYRAPNGATFWQLIGDAWQSQCPSHMEYVEL